MILFTVQYKIFHLYESKQDVNRQFTSLIHDWLPKLLIYWRYSGPLPLKQIFWWQQCIFNPSFLQIFIQSISHPSPKSTKRIPRYWLLKNKKSVAKRDINFWAIFFVFFSHFISFIAAMTIYGKKTWRRKTKKAAKLRKL